MFAPPNRCSLRIYTSPSLFWCLSSPLLQATSSTPPVLVVNLDRSADRWESCQKEFREQQLSVERFSATDGLPWGRLLRNQFPFHCSTKQSIGIMLGWYGMENGQKTEMGKKWKTKWKTAPDGQEQKWPKMDRKWRKNGKLTRKSIFWPFLGPCPAEPSFPFGVPFFSPFPALGRFPSHASPT